MNLSDRINPVALKELRQLVRSRVVAAGLIGFLAVVLFTVSVVLMNSGSHLGHGMALGSQGIGDNAFTAVYVILAILLIYALPYYVAFRMGSERSGEHLDLQYTTTLKPRQLVDGKVAATVILVLLFVGASLPFLSLAYLLRGLDMFRALLATLLLLLVAVVCIYEAMFLAAAATSRVFRVLLALGMLFFQGWVVGLTIAGGVSLVSHSSFSLTDRSDAVAAGLLVAGWISVCLVLRLATIALVSPASANRAPPLRGWITGLWLFWGLVSVAYAWHENDEDPIMVWALFSILAFAVFGAAAISGAPGYSRRVLAAVSPRRWRRRWQFLLFSGAENGMCWALVMSVMTLLLASYADSQWSMGAPDVTSNTKLAALCCYLTAYVWSVRFLWRKLLHRRLSYRLAGFAVAVLVLLGWLLPHVAAIGSVNDVAWSIGNAFGAFDDDLKDAVPTTLVGLFWAAAAFAANLPGLLEAGRAFVPPAAVTSEGGGGQETGDSDESG